jgi:hypothetical protein
MRRRSKFSRFIDSPLGETILFVLGVLLVIVGFIVAPLPGPGGIFFLAPGLALILKTSMWAKRNYVRLKRWQPRAGHLMDRGLRRKSAKRRHERRKRLETDPSRSSD